MDPYQAPEQPTEQQVTPVDVSGSLKPPAIVMLILAAISMLWTGFNLVSYLIVGDEAIREEMATSFDSLRADPNMTEEVIEQIESVTLLVIKVVYFVGPLLSLIPILGAIAMLRVRGRGMAMFGAIVMCIPCVGPCCGLGLPIGVWALVVLFKPEVKDAMG